MSNSLPHGLVELAEGHWFHPLPQRDYGQSYFDKYRELDKTEMGAAIVAARIALVKRHAPFKHNLSDCLLDVGIGGGRFCEEMDCYGYDINPHAVDWLEARGKFLNPYERAINYITCWDSLEHVISPESLVFSALSHLFVSVPIFKDVEDVINSKHFRPGEHFHYWTRDGIESFMRRQRFDLVEWNNAETLLGREAILSFAFKRDSY